MGTTCHKSIIDFNKVLNYNYKIIDYQHPGLLLAKEIYKKYDVYTDIYILKNHGIIITSDKIEELIEIYEYIYDYFNKLLNFSYNYFMGNNNISVVFTWEQQPS